VIFIPDILSLGDPIVPFRWADGPDVADDGHRFVPVRPKPDDDERLRSIAATRNWFRVFSTD
jgi:hypothetical protein